MLCGGNLFVFREHAAPFLVQVVCDGIFWPLVRPEVQDRLR
jgi:hypothetical protein